MNMLLYHSYVQSRRVELTEAKEVDENLTRLTRARERNRKFGEWNKVSGRQEEYILLISYAE